MALKQTSFFNFGELKQKEYDKKLIVITPNRGALLRNSAGADDSGKKGKNKLSVGTVVGFCDDLPRLSGSANWKSFSELFSDVGAGLDTLKDTLAATTGSTDFMYGDMTAKFFTGGGEFSLDTTFRCVSYTPWQSRYSSAGGLSPITIDGKEYLIGDCRTSFNSIFSLCFPGYSTTTQMLKNAGGGAMATIGAIGGMIADVAGDSTKAGIFKDAADKAVAGFTRNQPTVSLMIGHGNVAYFSSNKMLVKSVNCTYSEEWVKLNESTEPVPMFVDIQVTLELAQLAGLTDFANNGNAMKISFTDSFQDS